MIPPFLYCSFLHYSEAADLMSTQMKRRKELPSNHYTPFDYIMGQSAAPFHVEKEEHEEQDDQGDDKNKNTRRT